MLVEFTVGNFKTFRERASLSLTASNYYKEENEETNVILAEKFGLKILRSAVIFGANATGKSKFLEALGLMRTMALHSFRRTQSGDEIKVEPFALDTESETLPTYFEILFLQNEVLYRYGFVADKRSIHSEWLSVRDQRKEVEIFSRKGQEFTFHPVRFKAGKILKSQEIFRPNALLLSSAAITSNPVITEVMNWFKKLTIISGLKEESYEGFTMYRTLDPDHLKEMSEFLRVADFGISGVQARRLNTGELPYGLPDRVREEIITKINETEGKLFSGVYTTHKKYNKEKLPQGTIEFSLDKDESSGTKKFFALLGPVFDSLRNGNILIVDELDSKLHPNLVTAIANLFHTPEGNKNQAQLIFNSHNTNLLASGIFRRDQIWFTEKDRYGAATLYSLSDIKDVRKTDNFEESYIRGKYGAVPYLGEFDSVIHLLSKEDEL